ncbi:hypothetical protein K439DRAFT_1366961 [Ramaria rubella]|nr:hypothetical protein K439DRAFT_1366961 [Ramaria rubella]
MRRCNFKSDARILSTITQKDMELAAAEEAKQQQISNPAVRLLRQHIQAIRAWVLGLDQNRLSLRSKIKSTSIYVAPTSLWVMINPSDLHDPIVQILAGKQIDMAAFLATAGPDKNWQASYIASDPYAAAKFFHFLINVILETLFGIEVTDYKVISRPGIFGRVSVYIKSQGRGTLHLHLLMWLMHAPSANEMVR